MSYTGIIHRQDTDTGVTLRAKAVTPNKMKAAVKNYKITVRKNPESAYQKALDLQAIIKNGIASLIGDEAERDDYSDIDFSALINEDTTITITNISPTNPADGTLLSQCYNEKGALIAFPKINEPDAKGTIKFTTTTVGDDGKTATVSFSQDVVIKARDYHDLLNKYTPKFAWNKIYRNQMGNSVDSKNTVDNSNPVLVTRNIFVPGDADGNGSGYLIGITSSQKVISPTEEEYNNDTLLFPELGAGKVFIRTEIVDDLKTATTTSIFSGKRIEDGGNLNAAPYYTTIYEYLTTSSPSQEIQDLIVNSVSSLANQVQAHYTLKGLKIKSTLYMGKNEGGTWVPDATKKTEIFIPLETSSGYLTNAQVFAKICEDDNFKLQLRSASYDGTSLMSVPVTGVFTGNDAQRTSVDFAGEDVYARFPNGQEAGVIGVDGMIFGNVPVQYSIDSIGAKVMSNGQLVALSSAQIQALLGASANVDDCFDILSASDVAGSVDNSWRGAILLGSGDLTEQPITLVVSVNVSSYAVSATDTTYSNVGASSQTRYINLTVTSDGT